LIRTVFTDDQAARIDAGSFEALPLNLTPEIVADGADVLRPEAETGTTYDCCGDLATRAEHFLAKWDLPRVGRELV